MHNTYLPFLSAFSFYRTAYKERIATVEKTLDVVEKLCNYRPKHSTHSPSKSATRFPIFSGMGFSALSQQHFSLLNGALRNPDQPSCSRENSESDADNNIMETDCSNRQMDTENNKGAKFVWFGGSLGSRSRQGSDSSADTHEKMKSVDDDIELGPISSTTENMTSSKVHLIPQEATSPIPSAKPHLENHPDTVFKQATRVLKNTVLHDARNLGGQTERLAGWEVNSAHEAKVHHSTFIQSEENTPYICFSASGAINLPATERPRKSMVNPG
jgi:hypothetical protein